MFTSESGEWRLGGLDILSSMKEDDAVIYVSTMCKAYLLLAGIDDFEDLRGSLTRHQSLCTS